jgi:hypothetical protein
MLFPSGALQGIPHPHSHSIVLSHRNALIFQCKFFLRIAKNRLGDLSEFRALDFKEEFRRSVICMVSATIGNISRFSLTAANRTAAAVPKKTVTML